jgi:NAD+ synthase (glutamine-hydrolysing)
MNPTVGDLKGNSRKIIDFYNQTVEMGSPDLVVFPECCLTGYPPEDLLYRKSFLQANHFYVREIAKHVRDSACIFGFCNEQKGKVYNSAVFIGNSKLLWTYSKQALPNYGVFDEKRYFAPGSDSGIFKLKGVPIGLSICEDLWEGEKDNFCVQQAKKGVKLLINISASPYHAGKFHIRLELLKRRVRQTRCPILYVNLIGGQDELIFDGRSVLVDPKGKIMLLAKSFEEDIKFYDFFLTPFYSPLKIRGRFGRPSFLSSPVPYPLHSPPEPRLTCDFDDAPIKGAAANPLNRGSGDSPLTIRGIFPLARHDVLAGKGESKGVIIEPLIGGIEGIHSALVLGIRDYVNKNGFEKVLIGLSGGIDSALTACLAVEALGKDRVLGVTMPSRYSSKATLSDAHRLARNLGIKILAIPIEKIFKAYLTTLTPFLKKSPPALKKRERGGGIDLTIENLQPRIRGTLLMALSNKLGHLVLTTGNKSEMSVGYCTLYGDTAGGFSVLKDVPKGLVYQLSELYNKKAGQKIIPKTTLIRAPTAELRYHQKDQDTLPPYDLLDQIIQGYVEEDKGVKELCRKGFSKAVLAKVIQMIDRNEYKRRQSPPGIKITPKAFGKDRRMPITNRFEEII